MLTLDPNTVHNPSVHFKFAQPRIKTNNLFPESDKSLQETLIDLVSLKDNTSLYARTREKYIEDKLEILKMADIQAKANKKPGIHLKTINLGWSNKINLNVINKDDISNRLRCTWIKLDSLYECLIDTGASHPFLQKDIIKDIPKKLIIKYNKYVSGMNTAGGELRRNISAKITILTSFITSSGFPLQIPIEFLVADKLNGWACILGESFLGHQDLKASISAEHINLQWNNDPYSILLYYSKPYRAAGYILNSERVIMEPLATRWVKVNTFMKKKDADGLIEHDPLIRNNITIYPSLVSLATNEYEIMMKNELDQPVLLEKHRNLGLVYNDVKPSDESISLNNFINVLQGGQIENEDGLNIHTINTYNNKVKTLDKDELGGDNDDYEYEYDIQQMLNKHPNTVYDDNAANEFTEHLTFLPDPQDKMEQWTYNDVDIKHLSTAEQTRILDIVKELDVFAVNKLDVGCTTYVKANLDIDRSSKHFKSQKQRFMDPGKLKIAQDACDILLKSGVIRIAKNPMLKSNLCLVPRVQAGDIKDGTIAGRINNNKEGVKGEQTWRVCQDLRDLNKCVKYRSAPALSTLDIILEKLNKKLISTLDFSNGYYHIPLAEKSKGYMSFYLGDCIMEWNRLSQGYSEAPRIFCNFVKRIFNEDEFKTSWDLLSPEEQVIIAHIRSFADCIEVYMDDLWAYSNPADGLDGHLPIIKMVLSALKRAGVRLGPKKCTFATYKVKVLGVSVDSKNSELFLNTKKASSILLWTRPNSLCETQSRIFSLNYWERFLPNLREIIAPWFLMLRSKKFYWDSACNDAFDQLKALIIADVRLAIPDENSQLVMATDASKIASSQVLFIRDENGSLKVAGCNSRIFSINDSRKDPNYKEAISLASGFKIFSSYLSISKKPIIVLTDARNLMYISRLKDRSILANNLASYLHDMARLYSFNIFHIPGSMNFLADMFSRCFSKSKHICKSEYNLSKECARQLPTISIPFEITSANLGNYLISEILPEKYDKGKRDKNLPKSLEPLLELYLNRTAEERYVDSLVLLKQISRTVSRRRANCNVTENGTGESFTTNIKDDNLAIDNLTLNEEEIKTLLAIDNSNGSDERKAKFLHPIIDKIVDTYFGPGLSKSYKKLVRDALLLNYIKLQKIDEGQTENTSFIYTSLHTIIANEISTGIKEQFYDHTQKESVIVSSEEDRISMIANLEHTVQDDGTELASNQNYVSVEMWQHNNLHKFEMNNLVNTNNEKEDRSDDYLEEIDNTISAIHGDNSHLNYNILHANIEKLDKFKVDKNNIVEVEQLGTKRDIYFTCDGLYPPKSTPYAFDAGIDLFLQKQTVLKPGVYSKIDTGLKFLINTSTMGLVLPKSRHLGKLEIFTGVIDSNYSGPIVVGAMNITGEDIVIKAGEAIAQLTIQEITIPRLVQCEGIRYKQEGLGRGEKGFGSSGNSISTNLIESNLNFLDCLGAHVNNDKLFFGNINVKNIFNETLEFTDEIDLPILASDKELEVADQHRSYKVFQGEILNQPVEERQDLLKKYLGLQVLKQAVAFTDIMQGDNLDSSCLKRLQMSDEYLGSLYERTLNNLEERYKIIKSLLYKKYNSKYVLCIPSILLIGLIRLLHDKLGHGSKNATYNTFIKYFSHPMGKIFVSKYINACLTCKCTCIPNIPDKNLLLERSYEAQASREILNIDLIPGMPSSMGNTCMIIVVDEYSGYIMGFPIKNMESSKVEGILNNLFSTIGFPRVVRTDCDHRITKALKNLQNKIPFIISTSNPYIHRQNGKAENGVKLFKQACKKIIYDPDKNLERTDWCRILPILLKTINNLPFYNSQITREELFFQSSANNIFSMLGAESIFKFIENDDSIIKKYESIIQQKKEYEKNKNKSKIIPHRFVVGDIVVFLNDQVPTIGTSKFIRANGHLALFQVIKKHKESSNVEIQNLRTGKIVFTDSRKIRKIIINEFISELTAYKYFKNLPDFSKFAKSSTLESEDPLFELSEEPIPEPDSKDTNLTELAKKMNFPDEIDLKPPFDKPEYPNPIFDGKADILVDDGIVDHISPKSKSQDPLGPHDDFGNDNKPKQTTNDINDQLLADQTNQLQTDYKLTTETNKTHVMKLRNRGRKNILKEGNNISSTGRLNVTFAQTTDVIQ